MAYYPQISSLSRGGIGVNTLSTGQLVVGNGTSPVTTIAYASTATAWTIMSRDANGVTSVTNLGMGLQGVTGTSTTVLTVGSPRYLYYTNTSSPSTIVLPDATTLTAGWSYDLYNTTNGSVTVETNGGATLVTMPAQTYLKVVLELNNTSAGAWVYLWFMPPAAILGSSSLSLSTFTATSSMSTPTILLTTGATSGDVWTCTSSSTGAGSWQALSGISVTSVVGTANQLTPATATMGAVTVALTNGISLGSFQSTSPPSGGLLMPGNLVIGSTTFDSTVSATITGTFTGSPSSETSALYLSPTFAPATSPGSCSGVYLKPIWQANSHIMSSASAFSIIPSFLGNTGSINTIYGILVEAGTAAGTLGTWYSGYFTHPAGGSNSISLYADDFAIGVTGITPPVGGGMINGPLTLGTTTQLDNAMLTIGGTTANNSGTTVGAFINTSLNPSSGTGSLFSLYINPVNAASGTWSTGASCGIFVDSGTISGNIPTTVYSAYFSAPAFGTNKIALFSQNLAIGYGGISPPANGMLVNGLALFGTTSVNSNSQVQVSSTLPYNLLLTGTQTAIDGSSDQASFNVNTVLNPTGGSTLSAGIYVQPSFIIPSLQTAVVACGQYINLNTTSNVGTINSLIGLYVGLGNLTVNGTIASAYGIYVNQPFASTSGRYYAASIQGGIVYHHVTTATNYTVLTSDYYVGVTNTSSSRTISLPSTVPDAGWTVTIKDESGGAATNNIIVSGNGHNVDGGSTVTLASNYLSVTVYSSGSQYYIAV